METLRIGERLGYEGQSRRRLLLRVRPALIRRMA
jgi:hypothetical protein